MVSDFWQEGLFHMTNVDDPKWKKFVDRNLLRSCVGCGKPAGFVWSFRKHWDEWTCAKCYIPRRAGFLHMTRISDGLYGLTGEEIIALQQGVQRRQVLTEAEQERVLDEMKNRGWKY